MSPAAFDPQDQQAWTEPVTIGIAAQLSGVSAKMIRHYEHLGLLPRMGRTDGGYRQYLARDIHTLRFIKRSRDLGFSMTEIADLLELWRDQGRASAQVRQIATAHMENLSQRINALQAMKQTLGQLVSCCRGNDRPDCPILDDLAGSHGPAPLPSPDGSHDARCDNPRKGS